MVPWQLVYDYKEHEIPEGKEKNDFVNFFLPAGYFSEFFSEIFLLFFFLLSFLGNTPDTCAVWGSAQTPAVIGQTGPCDPTADFVGCAVLLLTAIKTLLGSILLSGVAITENCCYSAMAQASQANFDANNSQIRVEHDKKGRQFFIRLNGKFSSRAC